MSVTREMVMGMILIMTCMIWIMTTIISISEALYLSM